MTFVMLFKIILNKVRVILADSNDLMRVGLRTVLNSIDKVKIVGEARDNDELMTKLVQINLRNKKDLVD